MQEPVRSRMCRVLDKDQYRKDVLICKYYTLQNCKRCEIETKCGGFALSQHGQAQVIQN